MIKSIYAIFDRKTKSVVFVREADNIECFERWFSMAFLHSSSMFALYPGDYDVYALCEFDDESMHVSSDLPDLMCNVDELFDKFKICRPNHLPSDLDE